MKMWGHEKKIMDDHGESEKIMDESKSQKQKLLLMHAESNNATKWYI